MIISPAKLELELPSGVFTARAEFKISNPSDTALLVELGLEDFPPEFAAGPDFSLQPYASFPERTIEVPPQTSRTAAVLINRPESRELVGSVHGLVVFRQTGEDLSSATKVVNQIGAPLFVRFAGVAQPRGQLVDFRPVGGRWFNFSDPLAFAVAFRNEGNTYLNPAGKICLDNFCQIIDPWFVLPGTERWREVVLSPADRGLGRQRVTVALARGYGETTDYATTTVIITPPFAPIFILALLIALFVILGVLKLKPWRWWKKLSAGR